MVFGIRTPDPRCECVLAAWVLAAEPAVELLDLLVPLDLLDRTGLLEPSGLLDLSDLSDLLESSWG